MWRGFPLNLPLGLTVDEGGAVHACDNRQYSCLDQLFLLLRFFLFVFFLFGVCQLNQLSLGLDVDALFGHVGREHDQAAAVGELFVAHDLARTLVECKHAR